ncbi:MAG TPA: site-2 protease family protein [Solirubrobacteraceae bacterium]|jgi:Zn-dependent protease|nr:site-2 protease family protein [Solirubrobacteraceae bacterium]
MFGEGGSIQLVRVFGIRIGASPSWFVILFLAIYLLSDSFRQALGGSSTEAYVVAVVAALLFWVSLVLHELGHAFAARREGIEVHGIDLWLFGGLAKLSRDSRTPGEEFRVAAAGPAVTLLIVAACFGVSALLEGAGDAMDLALLDEGSAPSPAELLIAFLGSMNALLLVFNLVPAFPLDGGRLARALAWKVTGDRAKGTIFSAWLGQAFGLLLIGWGAYRLAVGDRPFGALWWVVLGWIIVGSARSAAVTARVTDRLEGIRVEDVMDREPLAMPATTTVMEAEDRWFGADGGWPWYPVVDENGRFLGIAEREAVEAAIGQGRPALEVRELLDAGAPAGQSIGTDQPLEAAIAAEPLRRLGAVMAVDADGRLRGVLTRDQVQRALTATAPGRG